jgi:glycosyltransferase involved in cell wall biosynthesis
MLVTVAICTWNRAKLLDQTLVRMRELRVSPGVEWELIVVNNNCTDETDAILEAHTGRLPLRYYSEPRPGKSHAANLAVEQARGELIIWTDDDVLVDPEWLAAYVSAAERHPDAAIFGGAIAPWYEVPPPPWVADNLKDLASMLAICDVAGDDRPFALNEFPFGANMAFRTAALRSVRFDPNLGPYKTERILGEETALIQALQKQGHRGVWIPSAKVAHFVTAQRMSYDYVWGYFHGRGRTLVRMDGDSTARLLFGVPRWLLRRYWSHRLASAFKWLLGRPDAIVPYTQAAYTAGMMDEFRARHGAGRESAAN